MTATLPFKQPLNGDGLLAFLRTRAMPGVEEVVDDTYRRSMRLAGGPAIAEVRVNSPALEVELWTAVPGDRPEALAAIERLFATSVDPAPIDEALGEDPLLGPLVAKRPGLRVPGCIDPGEIAVRAVLGQQVSVAAGITLGGRLVSALGEPLPAANGGVTHLFPTMDAIAAVDPGSLAMPESRKRALVAISGALADGSVDLSPVADRQRSRAEMMALPGIGPWTVEYVAMRALGDPDAFLATDLGARRALEALGVDGSPGSARERAEAWRPWRASALQHLWASLGGVAAP